MKHDKGLFLAALLVIGTVLFSTTTPYANDLEGTILLDKIAAVVNEEIITLTDIDKAIQFFPLLRGKQESESQFYAHVLEDLINYKVVYLEHQQDFTLEEEDYVQVQTNAIEKVGSLEKFMGLLKSFDMEWQDFKDFVREKVVFEKVVERHLQIKVSVSFKAIEKFYNEEYVPSQEQMGLQPRSLIEMTSQIENHLKKNQTQQRLADWLKEVRSSFRINIKDYK